jgi:hypothetical protein
MGLMGRSSGIEAMRESFSLFFFISFFYFLNSNLVLISSLGPSTSSLISYLLFIDATTHKHHHDAHFIEDLFILTMSPNNSHKWKKNITYEDLFLSFIFQGWVLQSRCQTLRRAYLLLVLRVDVAEGSSGECHLVVCHDVGDGRWHEPC